MARSKSSSRWLRERFNDAYVRRAQQEGYRSRASYKLLEILEKDPLLSTGMIVIDLGAAPGGWAQIAAEKVGAEGLVLGVDILEMAPIPNVETIVGDFRENGVLEDVLTTLSGRPVDLVMSDMAPNISGVKAVDQPRAIYLAELAIELACQVLRPDGALITKLFQGEGFENCLQVLRSSFKRVVTRKPQASRARSREVYVVATGFQV